MKTLKFIFLWTAIILFSLTNFAQPTSGTAGLLTWNFNPSDSTLTINGKGIIPDYYYSVWNPNNNPPWYSFKNTIATVVIGDSVTHIGNYAFIDCNALTSITIPNSVISIRDYVFCGCTSLSTILIPNTIKNIGDGAFYGCTSLISITIPSGVSGIGNRVFAECYNLISIDVESGNKSYVSDNGVLYNKSKTILYCCPAGKTGNYSVIDGVTTITDYAFIYCGLTSINIPNGVRSIGNSAFYDCTNLASVTIPSSVVNLGESAFSQCSNLTSATIGNGITTIGDFTFEDCSSLTSVTIGNSVTTIGWSAFAGCAIDSIILPNSLKTIENYAFADCNFTSINIPSSVISIGDNVFYFCLNLAAINVEEDNEYYSSNNGVLFDKDKTILMCCPVGKKGKYNIPNSVTIIESGSFEKCKDISAVIIPNSVKQIRNFAFSQCGLTSINIPNGVRSIGNSAFYDCTNLASVTIPSSLISIGNSAFYSCSSLNLIISPHANPVMLSYNANVFSNVDTKNCTLKVPANAILRYQYANVWNDFTIVGGYVINATVNNEEYGFATGYDIYEENTTATVTATANSGCTFVNWTKNGEVVSTDSVYMFTVTEDVELVAHFTKNETAVETIAVSKVNIYPNPTNDIIYLTTESKLKIYNIQGQLLVDIFAQQVDLSAYPQGMYFLQVDGKWIKVIKN